MTAVGRVFLGLYSVLLMGAAGGLVAMVWRQDEKLDFWIGSVNVQAFIAAGGDAQALTTVALGAVAVVGAGTLALAFIAGPGERRRGMLSLPQADGEPLEVPGAAVREALRDALEEMEEVREARVAVASDGRAVDVEMELVVTERASVGGVTAEAGRVVLVTMREMFGVTAVRRPHVRVVYEELSARVGAVQAERVYGARAREDAEEETGMTIGEEYEGGDAR